MIPTLLLYKILAQIPISVLLGISGEILKHTVKSVI